MRRKHIALKTGPGPWQYAVASGDHTAATLLQAGTFDFDPDRSLADQLGNLLEPLHMTDRLACAFPAHNALLRWLKFPFNEPRKIAAAAGPELACQLPGSLDQRVIYHQLQGEGHALTLAVDRQKLEQVIDQFDDNREPLGYLGLSPFCYAAGLEWPNDSLFLCVDNDEITISRVEAGMVRDIRFLPSVDTADSSQMLRQVLLLSRSGAPLERLRILGLGREHPLIGELEENGFEIDFPSLSTSQVEIPQELTATAALALAATRSAATGLNLRSGEYELKNDWQVVKRRAFVGVGLLVIALLLFGFSGYLEYRQQTTALKDLQLQMTKLYQQQFPGERLQIPAPQQLQSKMIALRKKTSQLGSDRPGALQILQSVSEAIDKDIRVDIRDYQQNDTGLRLTGNTESFDAVSRLLAKLQQQDIFREVRVLDSKQSIDGNRVDFQMQLDLSASKGK